MPRRGKDCVRQFRRFLEAHGGGGGAIAEVVCDMSGTFQKAVGETFENASQTVDCFHVVQPFTDAVESVRQQIHRIIQRWYSTYSNARVEGLNSIFQAARHRARGYPGAGPLHRHDLPARSPIGDISKPI